MRERIVELYGWATQYGGRPSQSIIDRIPLLEKEIDAAVAASEGITGKDLAGLNAKLTGKKLDIITLLTRAEWDKKQQEK